MELSYTGVKDGVNYPANSVCFQMPQKYEISSHYQSCDPVIYRDDGFLQLTYKARADSNCHLARLYAEIDKKLADLNSRYSNQIGHSFGKVEQHGDDNCLVFTVFQKGAPNQKLPLQSSDLANIANTFKGYGIITQDAKAYIQAVADGSLQKSDRSQPTPPPAAAPAPAPSVVSPSVPSSAPSVSKTPRQPYVNVGVLKPNQWQALGLLYEVDRLTATQDYNALRAAIRKTEKDYNNLSNTQIDIDVATPASGGLGNNPLFELQFTKPPNRSQLSATDADGVARAFENAGLLTSAEAAAFRAAAPSPSPAPATSIITPAAAPATMHAPAFYNSCNANLLRNGKLLTMDYWFSGSAPSNMHQYNRISLDIPKVVQQISLRAASLKSSVKVPTTALNPAGKAETKISVELFPSLNGQRSPFVLQDLQTIESAMVAQGLLAPQDATILSNLMNPQIGTNIGQGQSGGGGRAGRP
jgi:hypothetical protein